MSWWRAFLALACMACCAGANPPAPSLVFSTTTFAYDLTATRPYLPVAWGTVNLAIPLNQPATTAQVRFTVTCGSDPSDLMTIRSGLGVTVVDSASLTTYAGSDPLLATEAETWSWSGPTHGSGTLTITSQRAVRQIDALRALRQLCYANLGGPRVLAARNLSVSVARNDGSIATPAWTSAPAASITIAAAAIPTLMPVQIRFAPVTVPSGSTTPLQIIDLAGSLSASTTCTVSYTGTGNGLSLSGAADLTQPPDSGLALTARMPFPDQDLALTCSSAAGTSTTILSVASGAQLGGDLSVSGNPPLMIDDLATSDQAVVGTFTANRIGLVLSIESHPGYAPLDADTLDLLRGTSTPPAAISGSEADGVWTISFLRTHLRLLATDTLHCALRFSAAGGPSRLVPCVILLRRGHSG